MSREIGAVAHIGWGLAWGLAMLLLSVFLGAAGHGIFVLLGVFCAPISLLGTKAAWLSCIPFGGLLGAFTQRKEFPFVLAIHYLTAVVVGTSTDQADLHLLSKLPSHFLLLFVLTLALYLGGHILLWRAWFAAEQRRRPAPGGKVEGH